MPIGVLGIGLNPEDFKPKDTKEVISKTVPEQSVEVETKMQEIINEAKQKSPKFTDRLEYIKNRFENDLPVKVFEYKNDLYRNVIKDLTNDWFNSMLEKAGVSSVDTIIKEEIIKGRKIVARYEDIRDKFRTKLEEKGLEDLFPLVDEQLKQLYDEKFLPVIEHEDLESEVKHILTLKHKAEGGTFDKLSLAVKSIFDDETADKLKKLNLKESWKTAALIEKTLGIKTKIDEYGEVLYYDAVEGKWKSIESGIDFWNSLKELPKSNPATVGLGAVGAVMGGYAGGLIGIGIGSMIDKYLAKKSINSIIEVTKATTPVIVMEKPQGKEMFVSGKLEPIKLTSLDYLEDAGIDVLSTLLFDGTMKLTGKVLYKVAVGSVKYPIKLVYNMTKNYLGKKSVEEFNKSFVEALTDKFMKEGLSEAAARNKAIQSITEWYESSLIPSIIKQVEQSNPKAAEFKGVTYALFHDDYLRHAIDKAFKNLGFKERRALIELIRSSQNIMIKQIEKEIPEDVLSVLRVKSPDIIKKLGLNPSKFSTMYKQSAERLISQIDNVYENIAQKLRDSGVDKSKINLTEEFKNIIDDFKIKLDNGEIKLEGNITPIKNLLSKLVSAGKKVSETVKIKTPESESKVNITTLGDLIELRKALRRKINWKDPENFEILTQIVENLDNIIEDELHALGKSDLYKEFIDAKELYNYYSQSRRQMFKSPVGQRNVENLSYTAVLNIFKNAMKTVDESGKTSSYYVSLYKAFKKAGMGKEFSKLEVGFLKTLANNAEVEIEKGVYGLNINKLRQEIELYNPITIEGKRFKQNVINLQKHFSNIDLLISAVQNARIAEGTGAIGTDVATKFKQSVAKEIYDKMSAILFKIDPNNFSNALKYYTENLFTPVVVKAGKTKVSFAPEGKRWFYDIIHPQFMAEVNKAFQNQLGISGSLSHYLDDNDSVYKIGLNSSDIPTYKTPAGDGYIGSTYKNHDYVLYITKPEVVDVTDLPKLFDINFGKDITEMSIKEMQEKIKSIRYAILLSGFKAVRLPNNKFLILDTNFRSGIKSKVRPKSYKGVGGL